MEAKFQINLSLLLLEASGSTPYDRYLLVGCTLHHKILEGTVILNKVDVRPVVMFAGTDFGHLCHSWSKLIMQNLSVDVLLLLQLWCVMLLGHDIPIWRIHLGLNSVTLPA